MLTESSLHEMPPKGPIRDRMSVDVKERELANVGAVRLPTWQGWVKRGIDVALSLMVLVLLIPTLLIVASLVRISSPGPILYRQSRIGRGGASFTLLKFRTMYRDSDHRVHESFYKKLVAGQATGGAFKLQNDRRITPTGRVLRRYSLDEFPQLFNVLRGDMSLVGPRPPLPYEVQMYGPRELRRLSVLPGLTGLWQVNGRSALDFQQMIDLDLAYIDGWSLWTDLMVLARTPVVVVTGRGAS